MTDAPIERKRKSSRFLILLAIAVVAVALIAWLASRDSNDGPATGVTEGNVPVFEGTDPVTLGTGTTARELPGAADTGEAEGAQPAGDGLADGTTGATTQTAPVTSPDAGTPSPAPVTAAPQ